MTFVTCTTDEAYEILNEFPFTIRRRSNGYTPHENVDNYDGYVYVAMNGKPYRKHRVIMIQFDPVDGMEKLVVDHENGIRADNRLENLRWATQKRNMQNLHSSRGIDYEFIDELDENAIAITHASKWDFANYYVCGSKVLYFDGDRYRVLLKHPAGKQWQVHMRDVDNTLRRISKRQLERIIGYALD